MWYFRKFNVRPKRNGGKAKTSYFLPTLVNCKSYEPRKTSAFDNTRLNYGFYTLGQFGLSRDKLINPKK